MNRFLQALKKIPFHSLLIILFFLVDGYKTYIGLISIKYLLLYFLSVTGAAAIFFFLSNLYFRNALKTGIFTSICLAVYLFYGVLQDAFRESETGFQLSKNHILLPLLTALMLASVIILSKLKTNLSQFTLYLNCLFLVYLLVDVVIIISQKPQTFTVNPEKLNGSINKEEVTTERPDIFFIVLDEYSGNRVLKEKFNYDNVKFTNFLKQRKFYLPSQPFSNYSYTPFSIAATLNMHYPSWIGKKNEITAKYYTIGAQEISRNTVVDYLKKNGYLIRNYSVFDLGDQPSPFDPGFLALEMKLITDKTLLERVRKAIFWGAGNWTGWNARERISKGNRKLIELTRDESRTTSANPRFVYSHFMMPHPPFLYDSTGKELYHIEGKSDDSLAGAYIQYLAFTNTVVSRLIDDILEGTQGKAVVLILSDHGFRELARDNCKVLNGNFNAIYLPAQDYRSYYDSISNVNQFPALFNTLFKTHIKYLKDSCAF